MVTFSTLEATYELLTIAASGLTDVLPLGTLYGLVEELFESPGDGYLLFIKIRAVIFQGL